MNTLELLKGDDHRKYKLVLARWKPRNPARPMAVIYARAQAAGRKAGAQEARLAHTQIKRCEAAAAHLKAFVLEEHIDLGMSAADMKRAGLTALRKRLREKSDVDYVIVAGLDRLARSADAYLRLEGQLMALGVRLIVADADGKPEIPGAGTVFETFNDQAQLPLSEQ